MLKTIVVLPDGTELSSGTGRQNTIQSFTFTECVNDAQELSLGSACANMIEMTVICRNGGFSISEGTEFAVYREDEKGTRYSAGLFTSEMPTQASANSFKLTAYDRVSWLDKDLTTWLAGLGEWPYALLDFARMVCGECGLELVNETIPNGDYLIRQFSASGVTGRQLMKWVGEIAGRFCRATVDGKIEFAWYTPAEVSIGAKAGTGAVISHDGNGNVSVWYSGMTVKHDGNGNVTIEGEGIEVVYDDSGIVDIRFPDNENTLVYFQGGLSFSDYQVATIEKVQIKGSNDDVGTVYPSDLLEEVNTYAVSGNYLLSAEQAGDLKTIAQSLYDHLQGVTYTPCKVSVPASWKIHAGDIVKITDKNGVTITAYVMTKKQAGQRDTLECTGSARRDSSAAVNEKSYEAVAGKLLDLQMNVEGLRVENKETTGRLASLALNLDGLATKVQSQAQTADKMAQEITEIRQDAASVIISLSTIQKEGVSQVITETGYSFDKDGLHISKSESNMENLLDESGMYVKRDGEVILQANDDGVEAVDVTVRNYLIVGTHARFEDYTSGTDSKRTACFWL